MINYTILVISLLDYQTKLMTSSPEKADTVNKEQVVEQVKTSTYEGKSVIFNIYLKPSFISIYFHCSYSYIMFSRMDY